MILPYLIPKLDLCSPRGLCSPRRGRATREGGKPTSMPYWTLPDAALDDPDMACDWARRALAHL